MTAASTIGEGEVLLATIRYLITRGALTYCVSVPTGQGIDTEATKTEVRRIYEDVKNVEFMPEFVGSGPDIPLVRFHPDMVQRFELVE